MNNAELIERLEAKIEWDLSLANALHLEAAQALREADDEIAWFRLDLHNALEMRDVFATKLVNRATENEKLLARINALERALRQYGEHEPDCGKWDKMDNGQLFVRHDWPCTCGFEQALQDKD